MGPEIIFRYFPDLSEKQQAQFKALYDLYVYWNARINVISRKDIDNFYLHHVLHSLGIAKVIQFRSGTDIMDVGTGGGFPGIPLAILFPDAQFFLVDSIGKKIRVVNEVVQELGLENVVAEQQRAEMVNRSFDFIVSRAVTNLPDFMKWTHNKFNKRSINKLKNGVLYLKGGDIKEELAVLKKYNPQVYQLSDYFEEYFFLTKMIIHMNK
jgi:16S rRNA (guanine527-N7)-methyltransferase